MSNYLMETDRLGLRMITMDDLDNLHWLYSDPDTMKFMMKVLTDKEETLDWIKKHLAEFEKNGFGHWAVELKESKTFIGRAGFGYSFIENKKEVEMGWFIHSSYWNNGYGTEASIACRDYAFKELGIKTLYASLYLENIASVRVAEKIGMTYIGKVLHKIHMEIPNTPMYAINNPYKTIKYS